MLYRNCIIRNAFGIALCSIMIGSQAFANVKEDSGKIMEPKEVQQQSIKISGIVSDDRGETIPGATVMIKGTTVGTTTDLNGEYSINVPNAKAVLEFRTIGYKPVEITVGTKRIINAVLYEDAQTLDEVTVVAFGKQKKESLTSSITTVKPAELKVPVSNLTTALAGSVAGMIAYQRSGEPGADNADFFVRGITTFGSNTNPLILIDGVELTSTDLARLQPDEIESFSIMKDATATALYGARGANGVILVTTKTGKNGPAKIQLRVENSISMPTQNIELADPITYMKLENEAVLTRNPLGQLPYSQSKIERTAAGYDPILYPANDWQSMLMKDFTMNQRVNLSVSGGGGVARYYVAASFNRDNGLLKVDKRNNFNNNIQDNIYNLRANVNIDVSKTTEMIVRLNGNFEDYTGPLKSGSDTYKMIMHSNPVMFPAYYSAADANITTSHILFGGAIMDAQKGSYYTNPYAETVRGYQDKTRSQILAQLELKQDLKFITKGLSARVMLNIARLSQFAVNRSYTPFYYTMTSFDKNTGQYVLNCLNTEGDGRGTEYLGFSEGAKVMTSSNYLEAAVDYNRTFGKHGVSGLLVFQGREEREGQANTLQLSLPSRNIGLSGRATYSFDQRYFGEFNFGYNGSERFDRKHRFGFFPSVGAAWVISNEKFFEPVKNIVSNLKLRYSYGLVGNDQIGSSSDRFFYLSEVNMDTGGYTFGSDFKNKIPGVAVKRYANPDITWEVSRKQNFALEFGLFDKLNVIAEYYTEYRDHILMSRADIPSTMGLAAELRSNVGEASGKGVDLSLEYQQVFHKDLWASARANFTYATSKYEVYEESAYKEPWRYRVGTSLAQQYGYIAERLFVSDEEAANSPSQIGVGGTDEVEPARGGDIKYLDVNNDGVIDEKDMVPIGNPTTPEIVYGFGVSAGYKNFDFSIFFQGSANTSFWIDAGATAPFQNNTQLLKVYADSHWAEDHQDVYAVWPRLSRTKNVNNTVKSTWFMRDGAFMRLKQLEVGYSLPQKALNKMHLSNLRFYVSGSNLLNFSKFKLWDVEMGGNGLGYPLQRVFNIGFNLSFN
ncbi:MAG: TonB-dependent receptor [Bacteroides nordii]|nr:TonB-dependent receptor [Bacteroides nordii]